MTKMRPILFVLPGLLLLLLLSVVAWAGGVAPGDEAPQQPAAQEKVSATPAQTSAAVSRARQAVVAPPPVAASKQPPASAASVQSKAAVRVDRNSWMLGSSAGECTALANASRRTGDIGSYNSPQEFARKLQQRGLQTFVLDIGDIRDQVVRVKVPDIGLDLTFMKAAMCR